ncbi:MAG: hypothetical protein OHK0023_22590 [Anaerolineae bacterium]
MTQSLGWEKAQNLETSKNASARARVLAVGGVLMAAFAFLLLGATMTTGKFYITVNEVLANPELVGKSVKMTGAVIGETIHFDASTQTITFTVAHITDDFAELEKQGGLAEALHNAVNDPNAKRIEIVVVNQPMPDLLQHEAQAILTGQLSDDGKFYADTLQLKCPSRFQGEIPQQVIE